MVAGELVSGFASADGSTAAADASTNVLLVVDSSARVSAGSGCVLRMASGTIPADVS